MALCYQSFELQNPKFRFKYYIHTFSPLNMRQLRQKRMTETVFYAALQYWYICFVNE